jgi:hypothetical protein
VSQGAEKISTCHHNYLREHYFCGDVMTKQDVSRGHNIQVVERRVIVVKIHVVPVGEGRLVGQSAVGCGTKI